MLDPAPVAGGHPRRPEGDAIRARSAPALVLCSVLSVQFGQAVGKSLFDVASPAGVVSLRLGLAAVLLGGLYRPRLPSGPAERLFVVAFGTAIAGMSLVYLALEHLPIGVAIAIQLLGPLSIALAASRRRLDVAWSVLAAGGVILFAVPDGEATGLPAAGLLWALLSALAMGSYVVLSKRAGLQSANGSVLAVALVWAAVLWVPFGVVSDGSDLVHPHTFLIGMAVAVLSSCVPYSLELVALRTLEPRVVGVLQSLEPAVGAVAAFVVLTERLTIVQIVAIGCVSASAIGAVLTPARRRT